ncbi:MAG: hypothetical protein RR962_04175 [Hafnia sp.]
MYSSVFLYVRRQRWHTASLFVEVAAADDGVVSGLSISIAYIDISISPSKRRLETN